MGHFVNYLLVLHGKGHDWWIIVVANRIISGNEKNARCRKMRYKKRAVYRNGEGAMFEWV